MDKISFFLVFLYITIAGQSGNGDVNCVKDEFEKRKTLFSRMYKPGELIEDEIFNDIRLYDISTDKVLIVFWRTDCPYCNKLLTEIQQILNEKDQKKIFVIAISLGQNISEWEKHDFVQRKYVNLKNVFESEGYFDTIAKHYNVYGTPTIIVLNKEHRFIKIPSNINEFKNLFN